MDGGKILGNPLARLFPVATKNMGGKLGYVTSLDGGRSKEEGPPGGGGPIGTALLMGGAGGKRDELAELAKSLE